MSGRHIEIPPELFDAIGDAIAQAVAAKLSQEGATPLPAAPSDLMTVDEVASYLRTSRQSVYDRVHSGALAPCRDGRRLLFRRALIDAYLDGGA